jgi:hypothetical protein
VKGAGVQRGQLPPGNGCRAALIKGSPFEVGFEREAELYRKEHPMNITYIGYIDLGGTVSMLEAVSSCP